MARGGAARASAKESERMWDFCWWVSPTEPRLFHLITRRRPSALRPRFVSLLDRNGPVASTTNQPQRADRKATP